MSETSVRPISRWVTLKDVAAPIPNAIVDGPFGSNLKLDDYVDSGVPVLQGKNITGDKFLWKEVRFISNQKAAELKRSAVRVGDILLVKIGSIGYAAIVDNLSGFPFAIIPANLAKVTPNPQLIDTGFLHYWLTSPSAKDKLVSMASKTAQPALSLTKIKELAVPLPPVSEQRRIAAILDKADALRAKRRKVVILLDELARAIFLEWFGDPLTNPKRWRHACLRDLIVSEPNNGIFRKNEEYGEGLPVVWVEDLFRGDYLDVRDSRRVTPTAAELSRYSLHPGDILFCRSSLKVAGIGYNNVYVGDDQRALFECHLIRISPDVQKVEPTFLNFVLRLPSQRLKLFKQAKTVTMTTIDQQGLLRIDLPVPPLPLQQRFARLLAAIQSSKRANAPSLQKLDHLFSSLQHRAFGGEL